MKSFPARLKELRGAKTLAVFSKEIGVNLTTYQHYEAGTRKPNVKLILQVAVSCGVSADWLLGLKPSRYPDHAPPAAPLHAADPPGPAYCHRCAELKQQNDKLLDTLHNLSLGRSHPARISASCPDRY